MTDYQEPAYQDWGQGNDGSMDAFMAPAEQGAVYGAGPNQQQPQISQMPSQYQMPNPTFQEGIGQQQPQPQQYNQQQPQQFNQQPNQQPQFNQQPQGMGPEQYFAQHPQYNQQPQYQPQYQQSQQSPGGQMYPQGPVDQYGRPQQFNQQPQYQQPQQYGQQQYPQQQYPQQPQYPGVFGQPQYPGVFGQPNQQVFDQYGSPGAQMYNRPAPEPVNPLAQYDARADVLQQKLGAVNLALQTAINNGDEMANRLAVEQAQIQSQLTSTMVSRGAAEQQYSVQRTQGLRGEYLQRYEQMAQGYMGMQVQDQDRREFQQYMDAMIIPGSEETFSNPFVQETMLKAFAFDKLMTQRRQGGVSNGSRQAPRDYTPNMQGTQGSFGQAQGGQAAAIGFQALSQGQRLGFLSSGRIGPNTGR